MIPTRVQLAPGQTVGGEFEIVRPLGEGGMGAVYVAVQRSTGKARALKVMHPQLVAQPGLRERFEREARVGAGIESEHVIDVVGAGVDAVSGTPWIAMELLRGEDLAARIARGPIAPSEAQRILQQVCHALAAAHRAGVVHRDVKPENLFLADPLREGEPYIVKVLDFGVAKLLHEARAGQATQSLGSPVWMAPEQSEAGDRIGPPTDVWALGLVAFALLTGKPFWLAANHPEATLQALLREVLFEPIPAASARARALGAPPLGAGFDAWFQRTVTRDQKDRFRDAAEAALALTTALPTDTNVSSRAAPATMLWRGSPATEGPLPPAPRVMGAAPPAPAAPPRAAPRWRGPVVAVVLVALAGGIAIARTSRPAPRRTAPAARPPVTVAAHAPTENTAEGSAIPPLPGTRPPTAMRAMDLPSRANPVAEPLSDAPAPRRPRRGPAVAAGSPAPAAETPPPPAAPAPPSAPTPLGLPPDTLGGLGDRRRTLEALQRALHEVGTEEDKRRIQQQIDALRGG